ncbi:MAG: response regulator [Bacteroidetes bacterium]|nr:MAG: response regulator [Bacteroidota bacterium]
MKQLSVNNILIIEDDQNYVELIKEYLKEASFKYRLFHSASLIGGIELIEEKPVDLVLLDLSLDDTAGFNTLTSYLDKVEDIPVIVLTGNRNEAVGIRSVSAGAQDFLVKGEFNEARLINAIKYSIQRFKSQAKLKEKNQILTIKEKRYREAQKIGRYTNWEMNIVTNEMKWSDEMFEIFGFPHQSFNPTLSDYLRYVHIEDKEKVESFFENAIKTGELTKINHRILVHGRQVKMLNIRVQVKYDETTNTIILFGNLQDVTDNFPGLPEASRDASPLHPEIKVEYSAAIPKDFDFFEHLISLSNNLYDLLDSDLSESQRNTLSKMAISLGNYTKVTGNFQSLLPMLEQKLHPRDTEFNMEKFLADIQEPFILQKHLGRTIINFHFSDKLTGNFSGSFQNMRLTFFNLLLSILESKKNTDDVNIHVNLLEDGKTTATLEFIFAFRGQFHQIEEIRELTEGENIFQIENLKNLFSIHPLDLVNNAFSIKQLKGELDYEEGEISRLTFRLPIKKTEKKVLQDQIVASVNFLLAEDHVMNQIVMKKTLMAWSDKVNVEVVKTSNEILQELKSEYYDLLLLNVDLPDPGGIEIVKKVRTQHQIPILGISSYPSNQEQKMCIEAGMNAYLKKPFTNENLFQQILELLSN